MGKVPPLQIVYPAESRVGHESHNQKSGSRIIRPRLPQLYSPNIFEMLVGSPDYPPIGQVINRGVWGIRLNSNRQRIGWDFNPGTRNEKLEQPLHLVRGLRLDDRVAFTKYGARRLCDYRQFNHPTIWRHEERLLGGG